MCPDHSSPLAALTDTQVSASDFASSYPTWLKSPVYQKLAQIWALELLNTLFLIVSSPLPIGCTCHLLLGFLEMRMLYLSVPGGNWPQIFPFSHYKALCWSHSSICLSLPLKSMQTHLLFLPQDKFALLSVTTGGTAEMYTKTGVSGHFKYFLWPLQVPIAPRPLPIGLPQLPQRYSRSLKLRPFWLYLDTENYYNLPFLIFYLAVLQRLANKDNTYYNDSLWYCLGGS